MLVSMKNTALRGVSRQIQQSALPCAVLDTPPWAVFFIHTHGSALTITYGSFYYFHAPWASSPYSKSSWWLDRLRVISLYTHFVERTKS